MAPIFTLEGIRQFHTWTHLCLGRALDHLATIPAADYTRDVPGFGSPNLHAQVIHILNCEAFWVHTLQAAPFADEDPAAGPPSPTLARWRAKSLPTPSTTSQPSPISNSTHPQPSISPTATSPRAPRL